MAKVSFESEIVLQKTVASQLYRDHLREEDMYIKLLSTVDKYCEETEDLDAWVRILERTLDTVKKHIPQVATPTNKGKRKTTKK